MGVFEGLTDIQVALLRAQFIFDVSNNEYHEDLATGLFDLGLLMGYHPDGMNHDDLLDELAWMEVTAVETSTDLEEGESWV